MTNFNNRRVEVFSALGVFVRAFGIDVVASGQHEAGTGFEVCEAVSSPADVCKAGTASSAVAGALTGVEAVAIDQATGNVFVASNANRRIDVFSATGVFQGAFGRDVVPGGVTTDLEFCTTTCQAGVNAATAGAFATNGLLRAALTVGPDGHVYVGDRVTHRINEFAPTLNGSNQVTGVAFTRAIGWGVSTGAAALQTCTTTCQAGVTTGGAGDGQFPTGTPTSVAVDSSGSIYAVSASGTCTAATNPCRIQKFNADGTFNSNFGPTTGGTTGCQTTWTENNANAQAADGIAIDPTDQHVFVTSKLSQNAGPAGSSAGTYQLCEFLPSGTLVDASPSTPITTNATGYLAIAFGPLGRVYVNNPINGALGATYLLGPPPPPPGVTIDPVDAGTVTTTTATFQGTVTVPVAAVPADTKYHFEYSTDGVNWTNTPTTDISVGSTPGEYDVTRNVIGLAPNTVYLARLVGKTVDSANTPPVVFKTDDQAPGLVLIYPDRVSQTEATLSAEINPRNSATTYYFEWGPTTTYGNRIPATARPLGGGSDTVLAQETVTGLDPATNYHFRVVAENATDISTSDDQPFETLNECGYINDRCMELVSPADKGLVGSAGENVVAGYQLQYDAASGGDSIAYSLALGMPDSTAGGEVVHQATRTSTGWMSDPISPPILVAPDWPLGANIPSQTLGLSESHSCSIHWSRGVVADGGRPGLADLYRRNDDGSYTLMTRQPPLNEVEPPDYELFGVSNDCEKVLFTTSSRYPGISGVGDSRLYEWDEDTGLGNVGVVPGPSGPVDVQAVPGGGGNGSRRNVLSEDGSKAFFTATRQRDGQVAGAAENGKQAVFVRRDAVGGGRETVDVSESENATVPDRGATYQTASRNGEHVFFLANYGLTGPPGPGPTTCDAASTGAGCDLYRYDLADEDLVNLTADTSSAQGANVVGVVDASADGSYVYFAARGQLVEGEGRTFAENTSGGTYNVYALHQEPGGPSGTTKFVAVVRSSDTTTPGGLSTAGLLIRSSGVRTWRSRATSDGRYLAFSSSANITGYDSGGPAELYRYSYDDEDTVCASCRRDGEPAIPNNYSPNDFRVPSAFYSRSPLTPPSPIADDGRLFFVSQDKLAPGGVEGSTNMNLYEWEEGQVAFLATAIPSAWTGATGEFQFAGSSRSGDDVYFVSRRSLVAQDIDGQSDIYDARSGGGFAPLPGGPAACDPLADASCQGSGTGASLTPSIESDRSGSGDLSLAPRAAFSVGTLSKVQRTRLLAGRTARLAVRVDRPGRVLVKGAAQIGGFRVSVITASRKVAEAGVVRIPIALSRAARRHVAKTGSLKVALTVRFSEASKAAVRSLGLSQAKPKKVKQRSHTRRATTDRRAGS